MLGVEYLLSVNTGSSSIKIDAFFIETMENFWQMQIRGISQGRTKVVINDVISELDGIDFDGAIRLVVTSIQANFKDKPVVIGHRFVYGGLEFTDAIVLSENVLRRIGQFSELDQEHTPQAILLVKELCKLYEGVVQVACFDTAFFATLPEKVVRLPIPEKYHQIGIRRYGFHGLSYTYLLQQFGEKCGESARCGRVIFAHLGSGASLAACVNGSPIDTTMSYTPSSGIMMSTRSGDVDPMVVVAMCKESGDIDGVAGQLANSSGLKGVSGLSGDMYTLLQSQDQNSNAALAVEMFCLQVKKTITGFAAHMGGVDSIIFSGGMGENSPIIRHKVLQGLEFIGARLDEQRNEQSIERISDDGSSVGVYVFRSNESLVIAQQSLQKLRENKNN